MSKKISLHTVPKAPSVAVVNKHKSIDPKLILGNEILNSNTTSNCIALVSKRNSGKTNAIGNLLRNIVGDKRPGDPRGAICVVIFAATIDQDDTWKIIVGELQSKGVTVYCHSDIYEDVPSEGGRGATHQVNLISQYFKDWIELEARNKALKAKIESAKAGRPELSSEEIRKALSKEDLVIFNLFSGHAEDAAPQKLPPRLLEPKYHMIFDDLSFRMQDPELVKLFKINRHFDINLIVSTQYIHNLAKQIIAQITHLILFNQIEISKIRSIHETMGLKLDVEDLIYIYKVATSPPQEKNFLLINVPQEEYRKNFNTLINIE